MATSDTLRSYFKTISKTPLLTQEEEVRLAVLARKGDSQARSQLVESNLLFVVKIAREYLNQGLPLPDLIQEGNLGLIHALEKFDEEMGFRLTTYASWWIRLSIKRAIEQKSRQIRLPANKLEILRKIRGFQNNFEKKNSRVPTVEEIAMGMKMTKSKVEKMLQYDVHTTSFEVPCTEDGLSYEQVIPEENTIPPEHNIHHEQMRTRLDKAMQVLSNKERNVLAMRYGLFGEPESASLREVGKRMGLSPEGVRRIENKALAKLRRPRVKAFVENFI